MVKKLPLDIVLISGKIGSSSVVVRLICWSGRYRKNILVFFAFLSYNEKTISWKKIVEIIERGLEKDEGKKSTQRRRAQKATKRI